MSKSEQTYESAYVSLPNVAELLYGCPRSDKDDLWSYIFTTRGDMSANEAAFESSESVLNNKPYLVDCKGRPLAFWNMFL